MEERRVAVVVEDDADIRGLLVSLLSHSGFEVIAAENGTDGVTAAREFEPDIVTVDLGLPDIDGYEVTRQLRRFTDAYIIMLTARSEEIDTLLGLDAGADDFMTKPFRPREIRARVEAMMRRPRVRRDSPSTGTTTPAESGSGATSSGASGGSSTGAPAAPPTGPVPPHTPAAGRPPAPAGLPASTVAPQPDANGAEPASPVASWWELDGLKLYPTIFHVEADGRDVALTPTEFMLLTALMRSGRIVRSKAELSRVVRGDAPDNGSFVSAADERTVEVHLGNLRRKIGDEPRQSRWVQTVRGVGYRMAGTPVHRS